MALAIFDLDNTLINGDSDHQWGEFLAANGIVDTLYYQRQNDQFYCQYQQGTLDIAAYIRFSVEPLMKLNQQQLMDLNRQFIEERIRPMLLPKAATLLSQHRQKGDDVLIITATNRFITEPIAKLMGVDQLLATDLEIKDGQYTGNIEGIPCFQEGKVKRLELWLPHYAGTMQDSYFYSDSINDLPLLQRVDHPIAVDPDPQLQSHAQTEGWQIISLRT